MRRNILITGASAGLGAEMARQLAAGGHNLALTARREDRLTELQAEIAAAHPDVTVVVRGLDVNEHDRVFEVFRDVAAELGRLDRVIVNAGLGKGAPVGTGRFDANRDTLQTNVIAALAQCEAAMELFRAQGDGHLVVISSMSANRGLPKSMTAYAASKAGVATLAEGIRMEMLGTPVKVTTIYPGYIRSEMNEGVKAPFLVDTATGVRAILAAIAKEPAKASVPAWPWKPLGVAMRHLPLGLVRRMV